MVLKLFFTSSILFLAKKTAEASVRFNWLRYSLLFPGDQSWLNLSKNVDFDLSDAVLLIPRTNTIRNFSDKAPNTYGGCIAAVSLAQVFLLLYSYEGGGLYSTHLHLLVFFFSWKIAHTFLLIGT